MPDAGDQKYFLIFDENRFFALSWIIAELGNLKDNGLRAEVIKEAILQTSPQGPAGKNNEKDAMAKAYKLAGAVQKTIPQILSAAGKLCTTYCKEKNLESLIMGTAAAKN